MGDCASRPTDVEFNKHFVESNNKHDHEFFPLPKLDLAPPSNKKLEIKELETKLYKFKESYRQIELQYQSCIHGIPAVPYLNVEIQKGDQLFLKESCLSRARPFVKVHLLPNGKSETTFQSDLYTPYWYKLITFSNMFEGFTTLKITAYLSRRIGKTAKIGKIEFKIGELMDQELREGWFDLQRKQAASDDMKPKLRIRVQLLHDIRARLFQQMSVTSRLMGQVGAKLEAIKDSSSLSSEV